MNIEFGKLLILRTPCLPFNYNKEPLQDRLFLEAVKIASAGFYQELERASFDYNNLSEKAKASLWKYANRMKYRPTPFGLFSCISVLEWGTTDKNISVGGLKIMELPDFNSKYSADAALVQHNWAVMDYVVNPALYKTGKHYRYISWRTEKGKRKFTIREAASDDALESILDICKSLRPLSR